MGDRTWVTECPVCGRRWPFPPGGAGPDLLMPTHEREGAPCPGSGQRARDTELRVRHYVGLDLGQAQDFTAVGVIERTDAYDVLRRLFDQDASTITKYRSSMYALRKLERIALATAYPQIVRHVTILMRDPRLTSPVLVVDKTGVGAPVVDLLRQASLSPVAITITAGVGVTTSTGSMGVPKRDLVSAVLVALQEGTLKIAAGLRLAEALVEELVNFRVEISESGKDSYEARAGVHDDLVLSVALAAWRARRDADRLRHTTKLIPPDAVLRQL